MKPYLYVVMPVYNEVECIAGVVEEWLAALDSLAVPYVLDCLDDASSDDTLAVLRSLRGITVTAQETNRGHGATCLHGYQRGLEAGTEWILQIDSDGQCDPDYLGQLWQRRAESRAIYGFRWPREDGFSRFLISRIVSLVTWLASGVWVADPNSPYRLMHSSLLRQVLPRVPGGFHLANIALAVLQAPEIRWTRMRFRARRGGRPSQPLSGLGLRALQLFGQLRDVG